jgi:hypothetical protein
MVVSAALDYTMVNSIKLAAAVRTNQALTCRALLSGRMGGRPILITIFARCKTTEKGKHGSKLQKMQKMQKMQKKKRSRTKKKSTNKLKPSNLR